MIKISLFQLIAVIVVIILALEFKTEIKFLLLNLFKIVKPYLVSLVKGCKKVLKFVIAHKIKTAVICLSSILGLAIVVFACLEIKTYSENKASAWLDINEVGKNENYPVDMVYLWCEDTPERAQLRQEWKEKMGLSEKKLSTEITTASRYISNDELKYSLRSVEKYAPWVNKIYIVTDNQVPKWLNLKHPKIKIIDHKEIMSEDIRPVFNSVPIEYAIPNIPDLSEHFIYANDDMMFANPVKKEDFFKDGKPIYIFRHNIPKKFSKQNNYWVTIDNAYRLAKAKFGAYRALRRHPHHSMDPYLKSTMIEVNKKFQKELYTTMRSRFRSNDDIQRIFYSYYAVSKDKAYYKIQKDGYNLISFLTGKYQPVSAYYTINDIQRVKKGIKKVKMFCTNDTQNTKESKRVVYKLYMDEIFPEKSQFEK